MTQDQYSGRTRSVSRALAIVQLVMRYNTEGLRLHDIAEIGELSKATAHRLVGELTAAGLLRKTMGHRFRLGRLAYELGIAASADFHLHELCIPIMMDIAQEIDGTVFLAMRSGADSLCIDKRTAIRSAVEVGPAKGFAYPLGVGATGLSMLSALPELQCHAVIEQNAKRLTRYNGLSEEKVRRRVAETRLKGFSRVQSTTVPGIVSIGFPVLDRIGRPIVAISVSASANQLSTSRERDIEIVLATRGKALREKLLTHYGSVSLLTGG